MPLPPQTEADEFAPHNALPSVVIVGRPNVGKSTLFNAILRQRRSIVGDEPGITRDRIAGAGNYRGRPFELIDTGGIITDDTEMIGADRDLAKMLRKLGKPVSLAVNKIDSQKREMLTHEFHTLGFEHLFPVSAEHHLGLDDLLEHVTANFPVDVERATKVEHPVKE